MNRLLITALVALSLSTTATAQAGGICFQADDNSLAVVKKYSRPSKGSCKNFAGWEGFIAGNEPIFGTACLNSAGTQLRVGYTVAAFGAPYAVWMSLAYPSLTSGSSTVKQDGAVGAAGTALAGTCFQLFLPAP